MIYRDLLYGNWELPHSIEKLVHTKEMARLRNISMSVMPNNLIVSGPIPSRFQHGMGVCFLATLVSDRNPNLSEYEMLLPVSALLHDAGNPPFSHLSEPFLKEVTGYDGESFLAQILDGSETEKILKEYGIKTEHVVSMVTGNMKPISEVLHGSIDIDNLDNVGRFARAANISIPDFQARYISAMFRFSNDEWFFLDATPRGDFHEETTKKWQGARAIVYNSIYSAPHLNLAMMLQRAVELAYSAGELEKEFFFLDDNAAILYLKMCNKGTTRLVNCALRWEWYDEVLNLDYTDPPEKLKTLSDDWSGRTHIADMLAGKLKIPKEDVCAMVSKGRDFRKITIPFVTSGGYRRFDTVTDTPIYRIRVYMPQSIQVSKESVKDLVIQEIS